MTVTPRPLVLVVDRDPRSACAVADLLNRAGYRAALVSDGAPALGLAAREAPAAVVLDPMGRGFDGFELARRLRAMAPGVRLVAVTGWAGSGVRRWVTEAGFDTVLAHPVNPDVLLDALRAISQVTDQSRMAVQPLPSPQSSLPGVK